MCSMLPLFALIGVQHRLNLESLCTERLLITQKKKKDVYDFCTVDPIDWSSLPRIKENKKRELLKQSIAFI